jgi:hypothetical protein
MHVVSSDFVLGIDLDGRAPLPRPTAEVLQLSRMKIKLRQAEGFLAAADTQSFSRAAKTIGMTQSAFSQLIREMESALDVKLFDRSARRARPSLENPAPSIELVPSSTEFEPDELANAVAVERVSKGEFPANTEINRVAPQRPTAPNMPAEFPAWLQAYAAGPR